MSKEKCAHNCCTCWDISIDKTTLKRYAALLGEHKDKILRGVDFSNAKYRTTGKDGVKMCVFLSDQNLCTIKSTLGNKYISKVCRSHPAFFTYLEDRIESGYSLCCEECAKIILLNKEKVKEVILKKGTAECDGFQKQIYNYRNFLIDKIGEGENAFELFFKKTGVSEEKFFNFNFLTTLEKLEYLSADFKKEILSVNISKNLPEDLSLLFRNTLMYFIFRHLSVSADGLDLKSRTLFCLLSALVICGICILRGGGEQNFINAAVEYSAEIEYSDRNIFDILDAIDCISVI